MTPTPIRTTPTTSTSTLPPLELTPQVRMAPTAITIRLRMIPIELLSPRRAHRKLPGNIQMPAVRFGARACSSVEERRPSKPWVGGSNPPRRIGGSRAEFPLSGLGKERAYGNHPQPDPDGGRRDPHLGCQYERRQRQHRRRRRRSDGRRLHPLPDLAAAVAELVGGGFLGLGARAVRGGGARSAARLPADPAAGDVRGGRAARWGALLDREPTPKEARWPTRCK